MDLDLQDLANLAQVAGALTIVGGAIFGMAQLAEYRRQRRDLVASEIVRAFMNAELTVAISQLRTLPNGASAEQLRQHSPDAERAAILICMKFESLGFLVARHIAPFDLVLELCGGIIPVMWRKLGPWLVQLRLEQQQPSWAEWFQWLATQCEVHKPKQAPAYERFAGWKP